MDEDVVEGHFAHVVQARQHHPRHPERDDVAAGDQHVGRIVVFQFLGLLRPAERGMRPEGGTEPGVENVVVSVDIAVCLKLLLDHSRCPRLDA